MSFSILPDLAIVASVGDLHGSLYCRSFVRGRRAVTTAIICSSSRLPRPYPIQKGWPHAGRPKALPCTTRALRLNHLAALGCSLMCMPGMLTPAPCSGSFIWPEHRVGSRKRTEIWLNSRAGQAPASLCFLDGCSFEGCARRGDASTIGGSCDMPWPTWTSA
jgi:hypothetical protein